MQRRCQISGYERGLAVQVLLYVVFDALNQKFLQLRCPGIFIQSPAALPHGGERSEPE
jgi:hypothetical protein